jgi:hypothetical protein
MALVYHKKELKKSEKNGTIEKFTEKYAGVAEW